MNASISRLAVAVLWFPALGLAQWPDHKTAGEPRTPDGRVDFSAAAPRSSDGRPDLSGVWDRGIPPTIPPAPLAGFGQGPPGGLVPFQNLLPLFPEGMPFQPWAAELRRQRLEQNSKDHPDAHCLPLSPLQFHSHPQPRKVIQTPDVVLIMYEANNGLRQIFTDGRALPAADDIQPWWFGYSVGRWDGDTLVVQTRGLRDMGWLDEQGTPVTSAARMIERFRRPNYGTLEIEATIDDPKTFTRPWTIKLNQKLMPDTELIEFVCLENNRSLPHLVGK